MAHFENLLNWTEFRCFAFLHIKSGRWSRLNAQCQLVANLLGRLERDLMYWMDRFELGKSSQNSSKEVFQKLRLCCCLIWFECLSNREWCSTVCWFSQFLHHQFINENKWPFQYWMDISHAFHDDPNHFGMKHDFSDLIQLKQLNLNGIICDY